MEQRELINATCPECRGPLSKIRHHHLNEYECLVGHRYSARTLLQAHSDTQERQLWAAVVALEEATKLVDAVGDDFPMDVMQRLRALADEKLHQAVQVRLVIEHLHLFTLDA